ncbi:hypothetical protein N9X09_04040, partial [Flavobacteriaceae bacterium]|nr:hypothetical protein [Flavobacteriaceae bacterium]
MKKLFFLILISSSFLQAQSSIQTYPEGVYFSLRSFLKKTPDKKVDSLIIKNSATGLMNSDTEIYRFRYPSPKKTVKNAFAISYRGEIYLSLEGINKYTVTKKNGTANSVSNGYIKVLLRNNKFIYTENYYVPTGEMILGGLSGFTTYSLQGIIFDLNKYRYYVFKFNEDLKKFLQKHKPELIEDYSFKKRKV